MLLFEYVGRTQALYSSLTLSSEENTMGQEVVELAARSMAYAKLRSIMLKTKLT